MKQKIINIQTKVNELKNILNIRIDYNRHGLFSVNEILFITLYWCRYQNLSK